MELSWIRFPDKELLLSLPNQKHLNGSHLSFGQNANKNKMASWLSTSVCLLPQPSLHTSYSLLFSHCSGHSEPSCLRDSFSLLSCGTFFPSFGTCCSLQQETWISITDIFLSLTWAITLSRRWLSLLFKSVVSNSVMCFSSPLSCSYHGTYHVIFSWFWKCLSY